MERSIALKRLSKMFGKLFAYEIRKDAPSPEERAALKARTPELIENHAQSRKAVQERQKFLLANDIEYKRLVDVMNADREALRANASALYRFKITVGTANRLYQGDSWEEIFEKLKGK